MTAKEALQHYAQVVGPAKASQHVAVVRQYLAWGGTNDSRVWARYVQWLQTEKQYQSGTIAYHQRIVRAFFRAAGVKAPKPAWEHQESEDTRVAFSTEWIRRAIQVAQSEYADPTDAWILCTCTVYGLRSTEISWLRAEDIDLTNHRIFIHTAKEGEARWQWLPPAVEHQWANGGSQVSLKRVHQALKNLAAVGDLPLVKGADIHAIRRGLIIALDQAGVSDAATGHFIRWKLKKGASGDVYREKHRYSHPTQLVGVTEAALEPTAIPLPGSRAEDQAVWDHHPFLEDWQS